MTISPSAPTAPDPATMRKLLLRSPGPKPDPDEVRRKMRCYFLRLGGFRQWGQGLPSNLFWYRIRLKDRTDDRRNQIRRLRWDIDYTRQRGKFRSFRAIAKQLGISHVSVCRHWEAMEVMRFEAEAKNRALETGLHIHDLLMAQGIDGDSNQRLFKQALRCDPRRTCEWFDRADCLRLIREVSSMIEHMVGNDAECGEDLIVRLIGAISGIEHQL
ncbi:MAG: hypothetical protein KDN22_32240 [Verrucomicrobiae bacterium]|nr:hypothetical protein [Verrucomicrobiae bacterium]